MRPTLRLAVQGVVVCGLAALSVGQIPDENKIYLGGAAKWYDSFNERLASEFTGESFCQGKKLPGLGAENCVVNKGCCYNPPINQFQPETETCTSCQEVRGTWQGVLGTCIYQDIQTVVTFDSVANADTDPVTTSRCVPSIVDPTMLVFGESKGKMATGVSPSSSASNTGQFTFQFNYNRFEGSGDLDIFISTFLGTRTLFGKFEVIESELGSTLYLALGNSRAPNARPQRTSAVLAEESQYVFFEGFRIADFQPEVEAYAANRLPSGSCKHLVIPGDDMDSIARRYLLTWQEVYAFNAHLYVPEDLVPGDILAIGRHHTVKGPCINFQTRRIGPLADDIEVDLECTCTSAVACAAAEGRQLGETLFGIATRYGTSWQRIVDMNPHLSVCAGDACQIMPGEMLCVIPYLRNVMCETEYRRYPVVDNDGNSPGYLDTFFSCNTKWSSSYTIDKCCQFPRCKCCTTDGYSGLYDKYQEFADAPTANRCDVTAKPHMKCLLDPLIAGLNGLPIYSALCDDDCQLLCDQVDPTLPNPDCPTSVGLERYTGLCLNMQKLDGTTVKVCT